MSWTDLRAFAAQCAALGLDIPEPLVRGLELHDVAVAHESDPEGPLLALTDDEIRDRITALSIREHDRDGIAARRGMVPGSLIVRDKLRVEVLDACRPYLDDLVVGLQPRFAELAAPLELAVQHHGLAYEVTSDVVIDLPFETIQAHRDAKRAWFALEPLASFRKVMSITFGLAPLRTIGGDFSVVFAAGENWSLDGRYYLEGRTQSHLNWYALASDGLWLNTPTEVESKIRSRSREADVRVVIPQDRDVEPDVLPTYPR